MLQRPGCDTRPSAFCCLRVQVFVLSQENVKEKGYVTLFQYMTKNRKSLFARTVMSAPEVLQVNSLALSCLASLNAMMSVPTMLLIIMRMCGSDKCIRPAGTYQQSYLASGCHHRGKLASKLLCCAHHSHVVLANSLVAATADPSGCTNKLSILIAMQKILHAHLA